MQSDFSLSCQTSAIQNGLGSAVPLGSQCELLFGSSIVGETGLFPVPVTNAGSTLLLHSQKSSLEEHARVLVCPLCRSTPGAVPAAGVL